MAFVNELIPDTEKQHIDWTKFKAWSYSPPYRPWKWAVDRQRNDFLVRLANLVYDDTGTRPEVFALSWQMPVWRWDKENERRGEFRRLEITKAPKINAHIR